MEADTTKYYVDSFKGELVKEKDSFAPPERYYNYIKSPIEDMIIETYVVSESPLELIHFACSTSDPPWMATIQRDNYFKKQGVSNSLRLYSYAVPPSWYEEEVSKYLSSNN